MVPASSHSSGCISSFGSTEAESVGFFKYQSMSVLLHLAKSPTSQTLEVECFQPCLEISGKLYVYSFSFISADFIQAPGRMCYRSDQTSYSSGILLDGGSLAYHSSQHAGRHSLLIIHDKRPHHGCLNQSGVQGSALTAFDCLTVQRCVLCRQGFFSSVFRQWKGQHECL